MRDLVLYNTLSRRREPFAPARPPAVTMYVCGPTVYGPAHVGNARPAVVFDVLFRLLRRRYGAENVQYARNITDIDDKIIAAARAAACPPAELAAKWRDDYASRLRRLGVLPPTQEPLATRYIAQMQKMIGGLLQSGHAYEAEGHVLFHVPAFADYGRLSNRKRDEMIAGARVEVAPYKRDAADFVLWKPAKAGEPGWESPWGRGRPGWHIECSAMAAHCLGEEIDIHGGGQDLIFPHHENELAQSRCAHGGERFARFWLHNGHVEMEGEKMSKSRGNIRLLQDALARHAGETIRLALLMTHYRRPLNWNDALLREAKATLDKWHRQIADLPAAAEDAAPPSQVEDALADDLNTPAALAALHAAADAKSLRAGARALGLLRGAAVDWFQSAPAGMGARAAALLAEEDPAAAAGELTEERIALLLARRARARQEKNFAAADAVRDALRESGVLLEDTANGVSWRRA